MRKDGGKEGWMKEVSERKEERVKEERERDGERG